MNSPAWSEIPTSEGWWFDSLTNTWADITSGELSEALVDPAWRGLWFGPIIIPETPKTP